MVFVSPARRLPRGSSFTSWLALAWLGLVLCLAASRAWALSEDDFLPPDEAFRISAQMVAPDVVEVSWRIAPAYYLYHDQIGFSTDPPQAGVLGEPQIPRGR
ncbi:protein-disulfide reductase DsbD N-terminal domain-containing protein [Achromobacter sp. GG226]|nr:protein-disulfide reductase DsbD N-terminal domain-containing protein [Verticiella sp. GG226]